MRNPFAVSAGAVKAVLAFACVYFSVVLINSIILATIEITPALAQSKVDPWAPPIPPEILPHGKNPAPPKLKKAKCPSCQGYLDELQAALQDWYVLQYVDGEKNFNRANNPPPGDDLDPAAAQQAQDQENSATTSLGGRRGVEGARARHNEKVKGNNKTPADPDAGDKDKLAQRIKDLVTKYENCERHPPPECQPPPPPATVPQTPQVPQVPKKPDAPPPPPPPKSNTAFPEVPNCFPTPKAKADKVQELNDLIAKLKEAYNKLGKPRANDPSKVDPPNPDDPAAKQTQADIETANGLLKKAQGAADNGCPPKEKTGGGTGTGEHAGLPWVPYETHGPPPTLTLDTDDDEHDYPGKPRVRYVKVCSLYGAGFYYIPGTDTCVKIRGWVRPEIQWPQFHYGIDNAKLGGDCGYKCIGGIPVRAWDIVPRNTLGTTDAGPWGVLRNYYMDPPSTSSSTGIDPTIAPLIEGFGEDRLQRVRLNRANFLEHWSVLSPDAQKYLDSSSTLGIYDQEEATIRARMWPLRQPVDTASTGDQIKSPDSAPKAPVDDKPNSGNNPPDKSAQSPSDKPATSDNSMKSATPTAPSAGSDQKTSSSDTSAPGTTPNPGYIVIGAKIIQSTTPGKLGDSEPGALISLNVDKYPLRRSDDKGPGPQDGHDADRPICVTTAAGTCEMKITLEEKPYYGLAKVNDPRIDLTFDSMVYRGGFSVVGKDSPRKPNTKVDGGLTTDNPYAFKIGTMDVVRHTFTTPYDGGDGFPKNIGFNVDFMSIHPARTVGRRVDGVTAGLRLARGDDQTYGPRGCSMSRVFAPVAVALVLLVACMSAWSQDATLDPPSNHYFVSKGSWKQPFADQWGLQRIGFDASPRSAWRLVRRDAKPVVVAVIDTGIDWFHTNIDPENIWTNPNEIAENGLDDDHNGYVDDIVGWDFIDQDNRPWDFDGHGTLVAGIIAGSWKDQSGMAGVNPFARLMILKAINNFGHTRASYVAEAITYAANNGARVINLSVGGKERITSIEQAAVDYAFSKGVVIVVAAGNEAADISQYGIASTDKVLTVAASGPDDERAAFSNWGKIAVTAPGVDILSIRARRTDVMLGIEGVKYQPGEAYVGDDKRHYRASGTSFAAPFVAGLASLLIANDPGLTNTQVMNIIKSTARDVGTPGVDQYTGYGIIDAVAALKAPKDYFLFAGISKVEVVRERDQQVVRVLGIADANALKSAHIEIGQGENPTSWKAIGPARKGAGPDSILGDIPASALAGAKVWQLRVIVEHASGATREARFKLTLG